MDPNWQVKVTTGCLINKYNTMQYICWGCRIRHVVY